MVSSGDYGIISAGSCCLLDFVVLVGDPEGVVSRAGWPVLNSPDSSSIS